MTSFEEACHRHAIAAWQQRRNLSHLQTRIISKILRYSEASPQPTPSASMLLLSNVAAAGADIYRHRAPMLRDWTRSVSSEPEVLRRAVRHVVGKSRHEVRLHQDIVARLVQATPLKAR